MIELLTHISRRPRRLALAALVALSVPTLLVQPPAVAASPDQATERTSYVLIAAGNGSSTMSGSTDDLRHARSLRSGREALLYVRNGGAAYVIRDTATLRQAEAIFAPQNALGDRQGELGDRQSALGERQSRLGEQQAELGSQQAYASPKRAEALGRQQEALGRQQNELGRQQDELGRQQEELGREQERLADEANVRIRALLDEAVRNGVAQRVD